MIDVLAAALTLASLPVQDRDAPPNGDDPAVSDATGNVVYDGSNGQLDVPSPWVAEAKIDVDGRLDEPIWDAAPVLTGFTQFDPVEGVPASQRTEARILLTDDAVYFAVTAYDDVPGGVRATLGDRDSFARSDDYVRFIFDTFNDRRRAYVIMVNPYGVQQDGLWVEGGGGERRRGFGPPIDWNPDFVWDSGGRLHDQGYTVEVKLPLKSIRFRQQPLQDWGLQVERSIARNGYSQSWAPVTADVANQLEQSGRLTGLANLDPGLFFEINPVQTLSRQGTYNSDRDALERGGIDGDFGLNLTYGITPNLTLDGTYNPDFSQVEADASQIRVNERFALFLPEKRPFFLEGTEIFNLPQRLVYTRSIINPVGGAKLQGKIGSFNAGYLGAVDDVSAPNDSESHIRPVVNILRVRRDLGATSNIGLVVTDRTHDRERFNRLAGIDGRFQFKQRYTVTLLAAGSRSAAGSPTPTHGSLLSAQLARSGRHFQFNASALDVSDDFLAASGFIRRTGTAQLQSRVSYNFRGQPGDLIERWGPSLEAEGFWDHGDFLGGLGPKERSFQFGGSISFRGNLTVFANVSRRDYSVTDRDYDGLFRTGPGGVQEPLLADASHFRGLNSGTLFFWINSFERVRGNLRITRSESPLFDFNTDAPVDAADSWSVDASVNLFPTTHLSGELGLAHTNLHRKRDGTLYSKATIPRARLQYQFSRSLFVRAITEYGSQLRGRLLDPDTGAPLSYCSDDSCSELGGSESNDISLELLLSYEPTPGSVFFLGYSRRMRDTERFRFRDVQSRADGLFMKLSYRFRG